MYVEAEHEATQGCVRTSARRTRCVRLPPQGHQARGHGSQRRDGRCSRTHLHSQAAISAAAALWSSAPPAAWQRSGCNLRSRDGLTTHGRSRVCTVYA